MEVKINVTSLIGIWWSLAIINSIVGLTKYQLKKLQNMYNYLQSDPNDIQMSGRDNPEDFLKKLLAPNIGMGINDDGMFYLDESLIGEGGSLISSSEVWNLTNNDGMYVLHSGL